MKALNLSSPAAELAVLLSGSSAVPEEEINGIEALLTVMGGRIGDWLKIGTTRRSLQLSLTIPGLIKDEFPFTLKPAHQFLCGLPPPLPRC